MTARIRVGIWRCGKTTAAAPALARAPINRIGTLGKVTRAVLRWSGNGPIFTSHRLGRHPTSPRRIRTQTGLVQLKAGTRRPPGAKPCFASSCTTFVVAKRLRRILCASRSLFFSRLEESRAVKRTGLTGFGRSSSVPSPMQCPMLSTPSTEDITMTGRS